MEKDDFSPGQCQACVTRWDTGADPVFQFWIRDAHNHAMGEMKATPWSSKFDTYLTVPAGNGLFNLTEIEFLTSGTSGVYMSWQANTELVGGQMAFEPSSIGSPSIENCTFSGSTESGAVTHFQCHFECSA